MFLHQLYIIQNMINLKNLKSLFIEETEGNQQGKSKAKTTDQNPQRTTPPPLPINEPEEEPATMGPVQPPPIPQQEPVHVEEESEGEIDERIHNLLINAIESNNLDGFDYLEFKNSLKALESLPLDEATRFRSAFATAQTMGLTLDKLLKSADYYKGILDSEKEKFKKQLEKKVNESIYSRDKDKQALELAIQQKQAKIKALQEEINQHQTELSKLQGQVDQAMEKVGTAKNNFVFTYTYIMGKLDEDIANIKRYLVS